MTFTRPYPPDWLDDEEAAYLLCLSVSTFRQYVDAGALPAGIKIGKHRRWARSELNASLAEMGKTKDADAIGAKLKGLANGQNEKGGRDAA